MPRTYTEIVEEDQLARDQIPGWTGVGVCTAVAWSALTDDSLDVSGYVLLELTGRLPGCFPWSAYLNAFRTMGHTIEAVSPWDWNGAKTIRTAHKLGKGKFLVSVSGGRHAVAVVDGQVIDWTNGRVHRISNVWKVS